MSRVMPLVAVLLLFSIFFVVLLSDRDPSDIANVKSGRPVPDFTLTPILPTADPVTEQTLKSGQTTIVNFFASWCIPCRAEHDSLTKLATTHNIRLVGIAYKDAPADALAFLNELGNPFDAFGADLTGNVGIDFGITGVPETYLIDGEGRIRFHYRGPIVGPTLEATILPEIAKMEQ